MVAIKYDKGKPPLSCIPPRAQNLVALVMGYGKLKYGMYNYLEGGFTAHRLCDAALRHINQYLQGENIDESGNPHLAHAIASLMMLLENELLDQLVDDRYKPASPAQSTEGLNV